MLRVRRGTGLAARPPESASDATVGYLLSGASDAGELAEESDTPGSARYAVMPVHRALNVKGPAGHLVVDHRPALSQPLPYALSATRTVVARLVRPSHGVADHLDEPILMSSRWSLWLVNNAGHHGPSSQRPLGPRRACVPSPRPLVCSTDRARYASSCRLRVRL